MVYRMLVVLVTLLTLAFYTALSEAQVRSIRAGRGASVAVTQNLGGGGGGAAASAASAGVGARGLRARGLGHHRGGGAAAASVGLGYAAPAVVQSRVFVQSVPVYQQQAVVVQQAAPVYVQRQQVLAVRSYDVGCGGGVAASALAY